MRIIHILLYSLFLSLPAVGQGLALPEVKLRSSFIGPNPYMDVLGISDENALIIKAGRGNENDSNEGSYLAILSNGEVHRYGIFSIDRETVIRHAKIPEDEKPLLYAMLKKVDSLDPSQLNRTDIPFADGTKSLFVNDAETFYITIYRGKRFSHFQSEAPAAYIEAKVNGYESRIDFMQIFDAADYKNAILAKDINEARAMDTIYVYFQKGPYQQKYTDQAGLGTYMLHIRNRTSYIFQEIGSGNKIIEDPEELGRLKNVMLNYDFFLKYGAEAKFLRSKKIYIIDALELSQNKVKLKEVRVSFL